MSTRTRQQKKRPTRKLSDKRENAVRRERYAADPKYREMVIARARKSKPTDEDLLAIAAARPYNVRLRTALRKNQHIAYSRERFDITRKLRVPCFSSEEMAAFLGRRSALICTLRKKCFIPEPDLYVTAGKGRPFHAYSTMLATDILRGILEVVQGESGQVNDRFGPYLRQIIRERKFLP
jgi:hypothetical protein